MEYAQRLLRDAASTSLQDLGDPHRVGRSDEDILGMTRAAAARSFVGKVFDALGADPDVIYEDRDEELIMPCKADGLLRDNAKACPADYEGGDRANR